MMPAQIVSAVTLTPFNPLGMPRNEAMISIEEIENWFTYHSPDEAQQVAYRAIREKAKEMAQVIVNNTPPSADQTAAIRHLRTAVMTANAAIACQGK